MKGRTVGPRVVAASLAAVVAAVVTGCGASPAPAPPTGSGTRPASTPPSAGPAASPAASPAATAGVGPVSVDPTGLTRGSDPRLPWYDAVTRTLHHGQRATAVEVDGTVESVVAAGRSDLLVVSGAGDRASVVRLDPDGSTAVLARSSLGGPPVIVSTDARTFAWVSGGRGRRAPVVVARVDDGHQVARRRFANEQLEVLHLTAERAMVSSFGHTVWWNLQNDSVAPLLEDTAVVASQHGERVAARIEASGRSYVADVSGGSAIRSAWSLPPNEVPVAFSPDGSLLLTGRDVEADPRGYDVYQRPLRVRDAATGRVEAAFDGRFGWYDTGAARWEDDEHFLAVARDPSYRSGDPTMRRSWVRCSVSTRSCEASGPIETPRLDVPPYGPLERLVARSPAQ